MTLGHDDSIINVVIVVLLLLFVSCSTWSMKLRVQDQQEDQRGPGERLYERTVKHVS